MAGGKDNENGDRKRVACKALYENRKWNQKSIERMYISGREDL